MATIERIRDYKVKSGDCFFFDNNVWMFLFSPIAGAKASQQKAYSNLLSSIQASRATIFINSLIVSEYVNRGLKLGFKLWKSQAAKKGILNPDYKRNYRPTEDFKTNKTAITQEVQDILSICQRKPDDFNALDVNAVLNMKGMDFNDAYYAHFCDVNKLILVTDDHDLLSVDLPIKILTK